MKVELHLLQNFAPSCLNRDDTNTPKDCEFGGYRRARISSQCQKRAIRKYFAQEELLPPERRATRTKRLARAVSARLPGRDPEALGRALTTALAALSLKFAEGQTEYLVFLGQDEVGRLAAVVEDHWEVLSKAPPRRPRRRGPRARGRSGPSRGRGRRRSRRPARRRPRK